MKTLIGVPCMDMIHTRFVCSLMGLERIGQTHVDFKSGSLVYDSRNQITIVALKENADRILMIDSDMTFEPDLLKRLSADMDEGRELVAGLCFRRRVPMEPVIYQNLNEPEIGPDGIPRGTLQVYHDYPRDDIFQVDGCGFGCVMMRTKVLKAVVDKYHELFAPMPGYGEDLSFCIRARACGFDIHADPKLQVGHKASTIVTEDTFQAFRKAGGEL